MNTKYFSIWLSDDTEIHCVGTCYEGEYMIVSSKTVDGETYLLSDKDEKKAIEKLKLLVWEEKQDEKNPFA